MTKAQLFEKLKDVKDTDTILIQSNSERTYLFSRDHTKEISDTLIYTFHTDDNEPLIQF